MSSKSSKRLVRSESDKVIAGIASGMAVHYGLDVGLVRALWVLSAVLVGVGLIAYLVMWVVVPIGTPALKASGR